MPYEGEVAAFWLAVEDGEPSFRKTAFDVERAIADIRASGWPTAEEFVIENLVGGDPARRGGELLREQARVSRMSTSRTDMSESGRVRVTHLPPLCRRG